MKQINFEDLPVKKKQAFERITLRELALSFEVMGFGVPKAYQIDSRLDLNIKETSFFEDQGLYFFAEVKRL